MESTVALPPWYRSLKVIIPALVLLPPVGLVLLWLRSDLETGKKVFASLAALALSGGYLFVLLGGGIFLAKPDPDSEAHYTALERHRAQQRENAAPASVNPPD